MRVKRSLVLIFVFVAYCFTIWRLTAIFQQLWYADSQGIKTTESMDGAINNENKYHYNIKSGKSSL